MYFNVVLFAKVVFPVKQVHPWKLTWNPKMEIWKMISLFKQVILRLHVNFPGCTKFQGRNVFNFEGFEPFVGPEMSVNLMTGVPPWCFWGREFLTSTSTSRVKLFSANFRCELVWRCLVFQILSESNLEIEKNNTRDPTLGINWKNNHRCSNKKSPCVLPTKKVVKTPQRGGVNPVILGSFLEAAFFFPSLQGLRVVHPTKRPVPWHPEEGGRAHCPTYSPCDMPTF